VHLESVSDSNRYRLYGRPALFLKLLSIVAKKVAAITFHQKCF